MRHLLDTQQDKNIRSIAYFSMEIGINEHIPSYSGGLGVLAGDTIKTFADIMVPVVAFTLLSRKGYFRQEIKNGEQIEHPVEWQPDQFMTLISENKVYSFGENHCGSFFAHVK